MPKLEVRIARTEDAASISEILRAAFSQFKNDYTPEALAVVTPPAEEIAGRFAEGPQWVAILEGKPVGTVSVVHEPDHLYIRSMAVLPEAQGSGVGGKLLGEVETYAVENGFERLFLYTTYFSKSAIHLYEKCGFRKTGDTTAEEWYGTPGLAMEKIIDSKHKEHAVES
jgi:ribosomal protein S18 acetylase RimI-like enzyme